MSKNRVRIHLEHSKCPDLHVLRDCLYRIVPPITCDGSLTWHLGLFGSDKLLFRPSSQYRRLPSTPANPRLKIHPRTPLSQDPQPSSGDVCATIIRNRTTSTNPSRVHHPATAGINKIEFYFLDMLSPFPRPSLISPQCNIKHG